MRIVYERKWKNKAFCFSILLTVPEHPWNNTQQYICPDLLLLGFSSLSTPPHEAYNHSSSQPQYTPPPKKKTNLQMSLWCYSLICPTFSSVFYFNYIPSLFKSPSGKLPYVILFWSLLNILANNIVLHLLIIILINHQHFENGSLLVPTLATYHTTGMETLMILPKFQYPKQSWHWFSCLWHFFQMRKRDIGND